MRFVIDGQDNSAKIVAKLQIENDGNLCLMLNGELVLFIEPDCKVIDLMQQNSALKAAVPSLRYEDGFVEVRR